MVPPGGRCGQGMYARCVDPVERQVDAYNAHDLDAFVGCYADNVIISDSRGAVLLAGRKAMLEEFSALFASSPELHANVVGRLNTGACVVLHERIEGYGGDPIDGIMVYHVADNVIDHAVWFT
jgi:hypothetical protein